MPDVPSVLGAIVVILFTALAGSYSRKALWVALAGSASLYLLLVWRNWFGEAYWSVAARALSVAFGGAVVAGLWVLFSAPPSKKHLIKELTREDEWSVHNLWSATNNPPTGEARARWLSQVKQWEDRVFALMDHYEIPYEDQKDVRVLGNLAPHYRQYAPKDPDLTQHMVMLDVRRQRINALIDRLRIMP
jgi:hypothetical protein